MRPSLLPQNWTFLPWNSNFDLYTQHFINIELWKQNFDWNKLSNSTSHQIITMNITQGTTTEDCGPKLRRPTHYNGKVPLFSHFVPPSSPSFQLLGLLNQQNCARLEPTFRHLQSIGQQCPHVGHHSNALTSAKRTSRKNWMRCTEHQTRRVDPVWSTG